MIEESKHYALAIVCGAKRGPKDSDLTFSPASLRDFLKALEQPEQEPVCDKDPQGCWNVRCQLGKVCKNTSPRREWVGLTGEELDLIARTAADLYDAALKTEAKLKERNT